MKRNNKTLLPLFLDKRKGLLALCAFSLGCFAVIIQVVLIRAWMAVLGGNEFSFGLVLGVWLLAFALGNILFQMASWRWALLLLVLGVCLWPFAIVGARQIHFWLGIPAGNLVDIGRMSLGCLFFVFPVALLLGGSYGVFIRFYKDAVSVYAFEALGFAFGGLLSAVVFFVPLPFSVDAASLMKAWPGYTLLEGRQSPYGQLMVIERKHERSLVENGKCLLTSHDVLSSEDVHLPLLWHPDPKSVFMIGGGFSQAGVEALKHPLKHLIYAELDAQALALEAKYFKFLHDPRLKLKAGDPRQTLRNSRELFDVVIINVGDPVSLSSARFFTKEFLMDARAHLKPGGVLAVAQTLSENYVSLRGRAYTNNVYAGLCSVFSNVRFVPGDHLVWMASQMPYALSADILIERLGLRGIRAEYLPLYLKDRMSHERANAVLQWLSSDTLISTDEKPSVIFKAISFLGARTDDWFSSFMDALVRYKAWGWGLVLLSSGVVFYFRGKFGGFTWGASVAGFTQMAFQMTIIWGVQIFFGHAYALVGALSAGFMLGAWIGARWGKKMFFAHNLFFAVLFQTLIALCFIWCWNYWPFGLFVLSILSGVAGGNLLSAYVVRVEDKKTPVIYAADLLGAFLGALMVGVFLIPSWGVTLTMLWVMLLNITLLLGFRQESRHA